MRSLIFGTLVVLLLGMGKTGYAQTIPRTEFGTQFTVLRLPNPIGESAVGLGARAGYNFSDHVGVEAEINHFPGGRTGSPDFGETQALVGAKIGYGGDYGGIFAKVRPGLIHFSKDSVTVGRGLKQQTYFSSDFGKVAERYFQNHMYLRFDIGDAMFAYGGESYLDVSGKTTRSSTTHNLQASFGIGIHF